MTLVFLIGGYIAVLATLSVFAAPYRRELDALANELVLDHADDAKFVAMCSHVLESAYAWRSAPIRLAVLVVLLIVPSDQIEAQAVEAEKENPHLFTDERVHRMSDCYNVSILAVNPVFGLLMMIARELFRVKARLYKQGKKSPQLNDFAETRAFA